MPIAYASNDLPPNQGMTAVQVFTGIESPFNGGRTATRFPAGFLDGASNTVLIAEGARSVNWMKPDDIKVTNPNSIRSLLGNRTRRGPLIGMADGTVLHLKPGVGSTTLKAAITCSGGEILGPDW